MVMEGDLTLGGGHTMQHTGDVSQNYALETWIILLTNVTPINLIKKCFEGRAMECGEVEYVVETHICEPHYKNRVSQFWIEGAKYTILIKWCLNRCWKQKTK